MIIFMRMAGLGHYRFDCLVIAEEGYDRSTVTRPQPTVWAVI